MDLLFLSASLVVSLSSVLLNVVLALKLKGLKTKSKTSSYEVKELLADLLSGPGLVSVARIAPEDVFFKSMRDH
jgi:hypothetical protein